jgi:hypothetical protein
VIEYFNGHAVLGVVTSAKVRVTGPPQASVAVAVAKLGTAGQLIVEIAGSGAITGAVTSCTFIVCEAVEVLLQLSFAVQVLVIEYFKGHAVLGVVTSAKVRVTGPPQASVAVAVAKLGTAGQLIVEIAGSGAITGAVTSCTFIVCEAVEVLLQLSFAVQVLVIEYFNGHAVLGVVTSAKVRVTGPPQASVAVAVVKLGTAGQLIVEIAGSVAITGAVTSCTFIVCEAVEVLLQLSFAVQVLVIEYFKGHVVLVVVTSAKVRFTGPPQASVAVAVVKLGTAGQLIVEIAGSGAITGAVTSCTFIVCEAVAE